MVKPYGFKDLFILLCFDVFLQRKVEGSIKEVLSVYQQMHTSPQ